MNDIAHGMVKERWVVLRSSERKLMADGDHFEFQSGQPVYMRLYPNKQDSKLN